MKASLHGWWFTISVFPRIDLHNINEAERLSEFLRSVGNHEDAEKIEQHIKDQAEGMFLKMDKYVTSEFEI
jgi:hypothetical protein